MIEKKTCSYKPCKNKFWGNAKKRFCSDKCRGLDNYYRKKDQQKEVGVVTQNKDDLFILNPGEIEIY